MTVLYQNLYYIKMCYKGTALCMFYCSDELDAPDMTILDFNNLSTTQLRKLEASPLDSPDVKLDKEFFRRYARRELDYWSVSQ